MKNKTYIQKYDDKRILLYRDKTIDKTTLEMVSEDFFIAELDNEKLGLVGKPQDFLKIFREKKKLGGVTNDKEFIEVCEQVLKGK